MSMSTSLTASIKPQFQTLDGLRIRHADSGGSYERTVLLTSPWPESIYAFAPMWAELAAHGRLFAVDLPGFGASEGRQELMSPRAMGAFLAGLLAEADLGTPHIVAPDVGTSAARRSQRRSRSSTAATTASFPSPTRSFSTSDCLTAALWSSMPDTSSGRRRQRSTQQQSSTRSPATAHDLHSD
jgi:pimeloyl-ACP methyl ester carboxylesterase